MKVRKFLKLIRRGLDLLTALFVVCMGGGVVFGAVLALRLSDDALTRIQEGELAAVKLMGSVPPYAPLWVSPTDARDFFLVMLGVGVAMLLSALNDVRAWFRPLRNKESV